MAVSYLRRARLEVGAGGSILTINGLRMSFEVNAGVSDPKPTRVQVYNLGARTVDRVTEHAPMRLFAGYVEPPRLIYAGEITRIKHAREGLERVSTFEGAGSQSKRASTMFVVGQKGLVSLRAVVTDAVEAMGLEVGPLDAVPDEQLDGFTWELSAAAALDALLVQSRGITWTEVDGEIRFTRSQDPVTLPGVVVINQHTGMIGSPSLTDDGAKVRVLLNPAIEVGRQVRLESEAVKGAFRVVAVLHRGDTWSGEFSTDLDLRSLAA